MTFGRSIIASIIFCLATPLYAKDKAAPKEAPPPVVRVEIPMPAEHYGDWVVESRPEYFGAYTDNESGNAFGVLCGKTCVVYKTSDDQCVPGTSYGFLVNAPNAAQFVLMKCLIVEGAYTYATELSDYFITALSVGGQIGFSTALQDGRFSVSRYSLRGGLTAAKRAGELSKKFEEKDDGSLRDFAV